MIRDRPMFWKESWGLEWGHADRRVAQAELEREIENLGPESPDCAVYMHLRHDTLEPFAVGEGSLRRRRPWSSISRTPAWHAFVTQNGWLIVRIAALVPSKYEALCIEHALVDWHQTTLVNPDVPRPRWRPAFRPTALRRSEVGVDEVGLDHVVGGAGRVRGSTA